MTALLSLLVCQPSGALFAGTNFHITPCLEPSDNPNLKLLTKPNRSNAILRPACAFPTLAPPRLDYNYLYSNNFAGLKYASDANCHVVVTCFPNSCRALIMHLSTQAPLSSANLECTYWTPFSSHSKFQKWTLLQKARAYRSHRSTYGPNLDSFDTFCIANPVLYMSALFFSHEIIPGYYNPVKIAWSFSCAPPTLLDFVRETKA